MNSNKKSQQLMTAFLSIILLFAVVFVGSRFSANADFHSKQKSYVATMTDAESISDIDAPELMSGEANAIYNNGQASYGGTTTNSYTVRYNGTTYTAWCGDHDKECVVSTSDLTIGTLDNQVIRKVLYYSYASPYSWQGFHTMSEGEKVVVVALTLNYIRHGGILRSCCNDFYSYIKGQPDIILDSSETELSLINMETKEDYGNSRTLKGSKIYDDASSGTTRKRTERIKLAGNKDNYITIIVPSGSWLHLKRNGLDDYSVKKSGEYKVYGGEIFYFSAEPEKQGEDKLGKLEGQTGVTAYTADSKADGDQTLIFAGKASNSSVNISIDWEESNGYIWMSKNLVYSSNTLKYADTYNISTIYNYNKNTSYNMAGIAYGVYDKNGKIKGRFISSYNGRFYQDRETGNRLVFYSPEEYDSYGNDRIMQQYMEVPFGQYKIAELPNLWNCDAKTNVAANTGKPVQTSGFYRNENEMEIEVNAENMKMTRSVAAYANGLDKPVTGAIKLRKADAVTGVPLKQAEYTLYSETGEAVGSFLTNEDGVGFVNDTIYEGKGTDTISGIPIGRYEILETKAPKGYMLDTSCTELIVDWDKVTLVTDGKEVSSDTSMELLYDAVDIAYRGDFSFVKKDAETGDTIANVAFRLEDEKGNISVIIYTDENGYYSSASSYIPHTKDTNSGKPMSGIWFTYNGENPVDSKGALPAGKYFLKELRCDANRNKYKQLEDIEIVIPENGTSNMLELGDIYNEALPELKTTARDSVSGTHKSSTNNKSITIIDTVSLTKLEIGHQYTIEGIIMDKATERPLIISDAEIKGFIEFEATSENMSVDVEFTFENDNLEGKSLVVFEYLSDKEYYPDEIIASHEDINDEGQTISIDDEPDTAEIPEEPTTEERTTEEELTSTVTEEMTTEEPTTDEPDTAIPQKDVTPDTPSTGDGVPLFLMIVIFLIAVTAAILLLIFS